jgi:serine/threonine-protein kinase
MDAARWQRLDELFGAALAQPPGAREGFLAAACAGDPELHGELRELLAAHEASGVLDRPGPALSSPPDGVGVPAVAPGDAALALGSRSGPMASVEGRLAAGARLGPYEVIALLGAGGMGEVYRARDPRLGREVAIKRVRGADPSPEARRRFDREARAAGALNHPNLLAVYDVGDEAGMPYVVTELLEGETLRGRLRGGALAAAEAVALARQVLAGLAAAHEKGIVHRDLKPENLFLTADGRLKILDFGLAKRLRVEGGSGALEQSLTGAGFVVGTLGYTAPEQLRGELADARADLFAVGAVLFEMLAGRRAFPGATPLETMSAVLGDEPPPLRAAGVPAALDRLVRRCLAKRAEERPASARELLDALGGLAADVVTSGGPGRADAGARAAAPSPASGAGDPSREPPALAVIPFLNLTGDPDQAPLCERIAEGLIRALEAAPGLRVASGTSSFRFSEQEDAIRRLGEELRVDAVLEGSVRRAGERLRIAVQLVAVADSCHVWSSRYDLLADGVAAVQEEIAAQVAGALRESTRPFRVPF